MRAPFSGLVGDYAAVSHQNSILEREAVYRIELRMRERGGDQSRGEAVRTDGKHHSSARPSGRRSFRSADRLSWQSDKKRLWASFPIGRERERETVRAGKGGMAGRRDASHKMFLSLMATANLAFWHQGWTNSDAADTRGVFITISRL